VGKGIGIVANTSSDGRIAKIESRRFFLAGDVEDLISKNRMVGKRRLQDIPIGSATLWVI